MRLLFYAFPFIVKIYVSAQPTGSYIKEPTEVRNIGAYAINDTSVSLKWMPPYPPTGYVELYEILYYHKAGDANIVKVDGTSYCRIWTEYICATIDDTEFSNNETFYFHIRAKNHDLNKFGKYQLFGLRATFKNWPPSTPLNVNYNWIDEESLNVQWQHPKVPNGRLRRFFIVLNGNITIPYNVIREKQHYNYEVDVSDYNLKKNDLVIEIYTENEIGYSQRGVNYLNSPAFLTYPKIENVTDSTFDVEITPLLDTEGDTRVYIIITDAEGSIKRENLTSNDINWFDILGLVKEYSWFAGEINLMDTNKFTVGDNSTSVAEIDKNWIFYNRILDENHSYNVTFLAVNRYIGLSLYEMFAESRQYIKTQSDTSNEDFAYLWSLLLVPLLVGVICTIIIRWRRNKGKSLKGKRSSNIYPSSIEPEIYNIIDSNVRKDVSSNYLSRYK